MQPQGVACPFNRLVANRSARRNPTKVAKLQHGELPLLALDVGDERVLAIEDRRRFFLSHPGFKPRRLDPRAQLGPLPLSGVGLSHRLAH